MPEKKILKDLWIKNGATDIEFGFSNGLLAFPQKLLYSLKKAHFLNF